MHRAHLRVLGLLLAGCLHYCWPSLQSPAEAFAGALRPDLPGRVVRRSSNDDEASPESTQSVSQVRRKKPKPLVDLWTAEDVDIPNNEESITGLVTWVSLLTAALAAFVTFNPEFGRIVSNISQPGALVI
eukprot:TRINITY_DN38488_c0_g1_i1.p1 TRINITY_DN38488_c0_g1~~TRINITY_DN38488_c0_g1_i1.p1  ORF type:complete len:130 (-),score=24.88 TRINITY_DN38488_c0_g1_i1:44-433(-)